VSTLDLIILAGALAGGFVSGLTGFGTGLTALSLWLYVVPPLVAAPLVVTCSIISQVQTLPAIWHAISWRRVLPFIVGGLFGVPVGTLILPLIPIASFRTMVGVFLVLYCGFMLLSQRTFQVTVGGRIADAVVGFTGGVLGGMAGLSGPMPTIWASLRGWGKDERRGVFQAFNLTILLIALASQSIGGFITKEVGWLTLIALPGTVAGAWAGRRLYSKLGTHGFDRLVLTVLLLSGISLIAFSQTGR